jgi:hypothetical protein
MKNEQNIFLLRVLLTVSQQRQLVVVRVGSVLAGASVHCAVPLASKSSRLFAGSSQSSRLAVSVNVAANPIDASVATNGWSTQKLSKRKAKHQQQTKCLPLC